MKISVSPRRLAAFAAALLLLGGCATAPPQLPAPRPRLVVLVVIDGLPERQVSGYRGQFGPDGFNRFLVRGASFASARYAHAFTVTAAGHATILTGAYPHRSGIIGNEWRDLATGAPVYCTGDAAYSYIGQETAPLAGTSPRNLVAQSLGDVLREADARSKVIAVSGKDRGAILPAGRAGTAYMYMAKTGQFASSTYYMAAHPAWVEAFNGTHPADRYFHAKWEPVLPGMAYARSEGEERPWHAPGGRLPKTMGEGQQRPGPAFYASLLPSPFADALTLDFARAAVAGEALGADEATDILSVSLSGHDYVNHSWGPASRISHDHVLQLDNLLAAFFRDLDRAVGADNYVAVLTADHGFMDVPEFAKSQGRDAGRRNARDVLGRLEGALAGRFGEGPWVKGWSANGILLDRALAARRGVDARALDAEARKVLATDPGAAAAFTRAELEDAATPDAPFLAAERRSYFPQRSPDVMAVPRPGWMFTTYATGTTHGSPHEYDTHVPILFYGPRWVKPGRVDAPVEVVDIAPTLAAMLGIAAPSSCEGRSLPLPR